MTGYRSEEVIEMPEFGESSYRRFLQGDQTALEDLIRTYSDSLVRFAYSYVKNSAVAEDIAGDAFAALFIKARKIRDDTHLRCYLYKIVHNGCMNYLRRHRNEVPLEDVEGVLSSGDTEQGAVLRERDRLVYVCMQALPRQYCQVLQLAYYEELSPWEIGGILNKSPKQVYNLLARAKKALKDLLEKEGISHEDLR